MRAAKPRDVAKIECAPLRTGAHLPASWLSWPKTKRVEDSSYGCEGAAAAAKPALETGRQELRRPQRPSMKLTQQQLEAHLWGAASILRGKTAGQDYKNYTQGSFSGLYLADTDWHHLLDTLPSPHDDVQQP
jgi:hypothetical protein